MLRAASAGVTGLGSPEEAEPGVVAVAHQSHEGEYTMHSATKRVPVLATLTLLLLTAPSFAQQTTPMQNDIQGMPHRMPGMSGGAGSPADTAMMSGMEKMQHAMMAAPLTGDPDQDFVAMMIPHHQGAIEMAKTELQYGKDPEIRKLATAIVAAQDEEIAEMKQWQANHPAK
ncbi:MAG TPA: DUF305 domain-containing protein [Acetobacteraceae bacterium]|jgi:uncharacterized protein (DUF305 family)|nr:DUF305 domain-containing protein [Acetobacteraceae bacterium]